MDLRLNGNIAQRILFEPMRQDITGGCVELRYLVFYI
jgi:hypothetical protein